jgi:Family of unknown function (DUF6636)
MKILALAFSGIVLAVAAANADASSPREAKIEYFRTPSGKVACVYTSRFSIVSAHLRCDKRGGLRPKPRPSPLCPTGSSHLVYGDALTMLKTGPARLWCHGNTDTAFHSEADVLDFGKTWSKDGFTCTSRKAGLRCSNEKRHGFFIGSSNWFRF